MIPNVHLNKDWQEKVMTWFDQPGRKSRRRANRARRAHLLHPKYTLFYIALPTYYALL